ncbi:protein of unknown function (DUF3082) [Rubidibacter lacunae KORDI 51-2]|uniref:DUF3082 domain-containing protein n=1 Tax=Rubidibacter lacunae KORDI 51-2 TaxID=582515 RepID=U5DQP1_9CHRO|nr:DUF3082 domain-containing protein [Rubidibacter lacunae]ERN43137.1 protein of unknown function (DUF3082) [Rubidibacter lacunae KORDI 51-2]
MTLPPTRSPDTSEARPINPWDCLLGAAISSGIALPLYLLTRSIAASYANKPIASGNQTAIAIGSAVRTLVVGGCTIATALFALSAVGLVLLAGQTLWQQKRSPRES